MNIRNVIESDLVTIKERQKSLLKHYERLKEIKQSEPKILTIRSSSINKGMSYSEKGRKLEITKTNKALLEKLAHITKRKTEPAEPFSQTTKNIKSLNLPYRKKEAQRIVNENEQIAKRLRKQKAQINKKKFDKDYEKFKQYRVQLSKSRLLKYQENCNCFPLLSERKERSMTPTLDSSNFTIEKDHAFNFNLHKNSTNNRNQEVLTIEDDSSYEDDFN